MTRGTKEKPMNPILGQFLALFAQFGQKWFFLGKRALSVFRYSNYLTSCQKSEKTKKLFLRKMPNWWTDRQTDVDFIGPSLVQGSNNKIPHDIKILGWCPVVPVQPQGE